MEIKKSKKADLEDKRTARFLLSFAVVLTAFFVAFEYSSDDSGTIDTDMSMLDELHRKDDDMIPLVLPVRLKMPEARNEKSVSDRMKILDDDAEIVMPEEKGSDTDGDADKILDIAKFEPPQPDDAEDMPPILNPDIDDNPLNFRIVEQLPEYPGGPVEFMRWLTLNLKYPDSARRRKVQGRVMSQFVGGTDGSISDLRIVAPLEPNCDREVLRVLRKIPAWNAGMQNDRPCRTMVRIPVVFKL